MQLFNKEAKINKNTYKLIIEVLHFTRHVCSLSLYEEKIYKPYNIIL